MKMVKISDQFNAVKGANKTVMLNFLNECEDIHFLVLTYMVTCKDKKVWQEILDREKVHPMVLHFMSLLATDKWGKRIKEHPCYQEFTINDFVPTDDFNIIPTVPKHAVDSFCWTDSFGTKKKNVVWMLNIVQGGSVSHVLYLIENAILEDRVVVEILNEFTSDERMLEHIREEAVLPNLSMQENMRRQVKAVEEYLSDIKRVFKHLKNYQSLSGLAEALICWLYVGNYMKLDEFRVFFDVDDEFAAELRDMFNEVEFFE
jgi:hypothetical protein